MRRRQPRYTDDGPTCDFGTEVGDGACEFRVVACLNNVDPRLPACEPRGIDDPVLVLRPNARRDPVSAERVAAALRDLRNAESGETGLTTPASSIATA
jgi:hypothetical protein